MGKIIEKRLRLRKRGSNDIIYPKTLASLVITKDGKTVEEALAEGGGGSTPTVWHGVDTDANSLGHHVEVHIEDNGFENRKIGDFVDFNAVILVEEEEEMLLPVRVMITSTTGVDRASGWGIASDGPEAVQMPCLFGYFEEEEEEEP